MLRSKAQAIHGVGSAVCPLSELLGRLCEGHVGGNSAVDDRLQRGATTIVRENSSLLPWGSGVGLITIIPAYSRN